MESRDRKNQILAILNRLGLTENVYNAMQSDDVTDAVMFVLEVLETIGMKPPQKLKKTEMLSDLYRKVGNRAYLNKKFVEAMELFNKALLFAPKGSRAMILAYSNRSALLHYKKLFAASLIDVERCLSMSCPNDISEKLKNRRSCCIGEQQFGKENIQSILHPEFLEKYLKLDKQHNPQIPCASAAVGVIMGAGVPKVVANEDIDVGTVVAVETSFVSQNREETYFTACYYCHKLTLNLIPCDSCCIALFCGEDCRTRCKEEYHDVECQIVEILPSVDGDTELALKAVLKMRNSCKSWDEFINASNKIGRERMLESTVGDIFDRNNPLSLLNCDDEQYFKYGTFFNQSLMVSDILCQLRKIPSFLPNGNDSCNVKKPIATRSLAKTMMFLLLFCKTNHFVAVAQNVQEETKGTVKFGNRGMFSFLGKLNHSCNPTMIVVALNKEVALIAVQPIKRGTELTVSKLQHWLERSLPEGKRQAELFNFYHILCDCQICIQQKTDAALSKAQKQYLENMIKKIKQEIQFPKTIEKTFCDLCKALSMVCDTPNSKEYEDVFRWFRKCIIYFQQCKTKNILLGVTDYEFSL